MMGLLLAEDAPLHKAITAWSFKGWVPPAVIFYSGTLYRKLLENVISLVIQINYRLNICIGSLNSWLYFLTALRIFFNGSCSEDVGKYVFIGNSLEDLQTICYQPNVLFVSLVVFCWVHLQVPHLSSCFGDFSLHNAKYEWHQQESHDGLADPNPEWGNCLFPLSLSEYWGIHSLCQTTPPKIYLQLQSPVHSLWLNADCNL